jgi:hypothetical protein
LNLPATSIYIRKECPAFHGLVCFHGVGRTASM